MGSVQHDIHDIGKDIVVMMLRGSGFEVVDLGVDVPPERFVEAIREAQAGGRRPERAVDHLLQVGCRRRSRPSARRAFATR